MANTLKPKRSSVAGNIPTTTNLTSGELGVNMADQKVWINNGTSVVQIGSGKLSGLADVVLSSLATGQGLSWNGTNWVNSSAGSGTVTSVSGTGTVSGLTLSGTVTGSGNLTLSGAITGFLPLTGGTLSGAFLDFSNSNPSLRITSGPGTFNIGDDDIVNLASGALVATPSSRATSGVAILSTFAYGVSQGDNKTHFGYNTGSSYVNYIRGAATYFDSGTVQIAGSQVLHAGNFSSYAPSLSSTYADPAWITSIASSKLTGTIDNARLNGGTYTINVTGSAGSVAWTNVSGRPTAVSSFTNDSGYITSAFSGFMLRSSGAQANPNTNFASSAYRFDPNANNPTNEHYAILTYGNESNVTGQLATHFVSGQTFTRAYNSAWSAWRTQIDSSNYTSYSPSLTGSGASGTWGINVTGSSASTTGNAATATALQTARTINGVSFNGTANITVADSTKLPLTGGTLTGQLNSSGGDSARLFQSNNTSAGGPAQFFIDHNLGDVNIGNARGRLLFPSNMASTGGMTAWNVTSPGTSVGNYHIGTASGTGSSGGAITFGARDASSGANAQAGIYITSDGSFGTRMYLATTDSYATGARTSVSISEGGNVNIVRGALTQGGNQVLHAGNFTSYSPSLTGAGASGTWNISITGSVASSNAVNGLTLTSSANGINPDNVTQNQLGYNTSVSLFGQTDGGLYSSAHSTPWIHQIYGDFRTGQIATRGKNSGTWQAWRVQLDSGNFSSYSPSLTGSGASGTWGISVTGTANGLSSSNYINRTGSSGNLNTDFSNTPAGTQRYQGDDSNLTNSPGGTWWIYENKRHSNSSNVWGTQVAWGWEDNSNRLMQRNVSGNSWSGWVEYLNTGGRTFSGNLTMSGNISGNSDERLKTNWREMPENFVARLAKVRVGIYDRLDEDGVTQVGVSAQSFQELLPQAIMTAKDELGTLAVSYGNAALASAVELAKDNVDLRARVAKLEALVSKLIEG